MTFGVSIKTDIASPGLRAVTSLSSILLSAIVVLYLGLGLAYAHFVPAWQAPDEPAHFNYVKFLAERGQLPVLTQGDFPNVTPGPDFSPSSDISGFRYESHQPPLYYAFAAALYKLGARVAVLRAFSLLLGAVLLVMTFACSRLVLPAWDAGALAAAAFVAFLPMHLFMSASINNDTLSEVVASSLLLVFLGVVAGYRVRGLWLLTGLLLGAALLTKVTIYVPSALLVLGTILVGAGFKPARAGAAWRGSPLVPAAGGFETRPYKDATESAVDWRNILGAASIAGLTALVVAGWWFVRNGLIYGWTDLAAQSRQDLVNGAQLHQGSLGGTAAAAFLITTFHSFWAQFGWMSIPVSDATYKKLLLVSGFLVVGVAAFVLRCTLAVRRKTCLPVGDGPLMTSARAWRLVLDGAALAVLWASVLAGLLYYNLKFVQDQGRYLFPALIPIAIAASCGAAGLFPRRLQPFVLGIGAAAMLWFALFSLRHDLIPVFAR